MSSIVILWIMFQICFPEPQPLEQTCLGFVSLCPAPPASFPRPLPLLHSASSMGCSLPPLAVSLLTSDKYKGFCCPTVFTGETQRCQKPIASSWPPPSFHQLLTDLEVLKALSVLEASFHHFLTVNVLAKKVTRWTRLSSSWAGLGVFSFCVELGAEGALTETPG